MQSRICEILCPPEWADILQILHCEENTAQHLWTPAEPGCRAIIKNISTRSVDRFLKEVDLRRTACATGCTWTTPTTRRSMPPPNRSVTCTGVLRSFTTVEFTSCAATRNRNPGLGEGVSTPLPHSWAIERQDAHYIRHGTRTLIANFEVATGEVISPSIGPTRNEQDFVNHVSRTVALDPDAAWIFIVDNLNIHVSEALVRFVADLCDPQLDIGIKGRSGILRSMATRMDFLTDNQHRIRFVYTPKRASWLNQIELWFSILGRLCVSSDRIRGHRSEKPFKWKPAIETRTLACQSIRNF